tara:strand:+ start:2632 stop:2958 length:327 start_codon:yes stop_codon:yes gene_type:complete
MLKQVVAYETYGIFGDYDCNVPDTYTICLVATEELAKEICAKLNENPRDYSVVCVDGWEHCKRFSYRRELTDKPTDVSHNIKEAYENFIDEYSDDPRENGWVGSDGLP